MEKEQAKREVKYRLAKWIISSLMNEGKISPEEAAKAAQQLLEKYDPPSKSVEVL